MNFRLSVLSGVVSLALCGTSHAVTFNFTFLAGTSAEAQQAFVDAGARWSALLTDEVVVEMTVGTAELGTGVRVSAASRRASFSYTNVAAALAADQLSASDSVAVANLPAGSTFGMLINRTSDNPNGAGSATPYLDLAGANNQTINMSTANAKALGLAPGAGTVGNCVATCDGSLTLSTSFAYDFDPTDGIAAGAYDFVGIATHEMGHTLGFLSGVDILDINSPPVNGPFAANQFTFVTPLDLFRYSALSIASDVTDFSADTRAKYFSLDGGATVGPGFATGRNFGDAQQAGHWKDSLGIGLMDPTAAEGELLGVTTTDIQAFDVIGWNVVPEPTTFALFGGALAGLAARGSAARGRSAN